MQKTPTSEAASILKRLRASLASGAVFFHMASRAVLKNENGKQVFNGKTDYLTEFTRVAEEIRQGKKQSDYIPFEATAECLKIIDECRRQMKLVYPFEKTI